MGLQEVAAADLAAILADDVGGFAVLITVPDPNNNQATIKGQATDIGEVIDPETGVAVAGRKASVALSIRALRAAGFATDPRGVNGSSSRPWVVEFTLPTGDAQTFKVAKTMPDKLGCLVCLLEEYVR
jgi:hypothetical protein